MVLKWTPFVIIQVGIHLGFPFRFCGSWYRQFVWCLPQSGKLFSRELYLIMGCLKNLFPWSQILYQRFSPLTRGSSLPWGWEHGWEGLPFPLDPIWFLSSWIKCLGYKWPVCSTTVLLFDCSPICISSVCYNLFVLTLMLDVWLLFQSSLTMCF